jgi:hypothetical protein
VSGSNRIYEFRFTAQELTHVIHLPRIQQRLPNPPQNLTGIIAKHLPVPTRTTTPSNRPVIASRSTRIASRGASASQRSRLTKIAA